MTRRLAGVTQKLSANAFQLVKKLAAGIAILLAVFFIGRIYESQSGPALQRWHSWAPEEMSAEAIDAASFASWLAQEDALFRALKQQVSDDIAADQRTSLNRYYPGSLVYPGRFPRDWNRSFILMPTGQPRGAVVLLHGLTDAPYSLKSIAENYQRRGFIAVAPRLPGHGTVPGALTQVVWQDWLATTRLAVREASRLAGPALPLHIVGYSNGGALAMKYALDSLSDASLRRPQQIVLLSPMIGVTRFARFAGLAGVPAFFPAFAKAAWLNITPEFNPFKYNSFPVNAARQSWLLSRTLQQQIIDDSRRQLLDQLPPVLTFQSVMDSTVSTRAVVESLYDYLSDNGSELVLFDINQAGSFAALFRPASYSAVTTLLPPMARRYNVTVIGNASASSPLTVERHIAAGQREERVRPLGIRYPQEMYSLSHVAVPFPISDPLYGSQPQPKNQYGISLGTISLRGESSVLIVEPESLMRATSNPFYPYIQARLDHNIACSDRPDVVPCIRAGIPLTDQP
ncbi:alpha/beta fold hydrolase [Entomohabitans teleogrylli]|uniref:alpha/beta hydrolase n=1 Tax=Entomohabitans teleogrylli TaxID=1384589 RepID=UPI00073DA8F7